MTNTEIIQKLTGSTDTALIDVLLSEATNRILELTGRTKLPTGLEPAVRELAVLMYNRLGSEGMSSRNDSEIGISSTFVDIPDDLMKQICRWRLCRVGGAFYEAD